ncbi:MAG: hypothetical protein LIP01_16025 [Tannerellaceae bacterium]|nr:hypothetical protein [Tannerellaceae bacterium]
MNYGVFYYTSRGRWVSARYLPASYRKYDLYVMYKVVINERQPWINNKYHKEIMPVIKMTEHRL